MLKILIADDEVSIIQLTKRLISPEIAHQIVGETTDGMSALALMEAEKPDIVITDIRMPGLNGIELIRSAREKGIAAEFIIISGYKDFQYAQNAIWYGASAYLLKPIKADELNNALRQILQKRGETEKLKSKIADMEHTIAKNRLNRRKELLASYVRHVNEPVGFGGETLSEEFEKVFHVQKGFFAVLILKLDSEEEMETGFYEENLEVLGEKYYRTLKDHCYDLETYCQGSRCYLLFHAEESQFRGIVDKIDALMEDKISQYNMYQVTTAVGARVDAPEKLEFAFQSADYWIVQRLRLGFGRFLRDHNSRLLKKVELSEEMKQRLTRILYELNTEDFEDFFQRAYKEVSVDYEGDPYYIKKHLELLARCVGELNREQDDVGEKDAKDMPETFGAKTDSCCSLEEVYRLCLKYSLDQLAALLHRRKEGIGRPVKRMKTYIREHYRENLSLSDIVGAAGLSNAYGSSIFKKETGMTITNYLIQVRIEEAQRLIRETDLNISEIAYEVGYMDTRYFSKLFIKTVGIKPVDYRKFYN